MPPTDFQAPQDASTTVQNVGVDGLCEQLKKKRSSCSVSTCSSPDERVIEKLVVWLPLTTGGKHIREPTSETIPQEWATSPAQSHSPSPSLTTFSSRPNACRRTLLSSPLYSRPCTRRTWINLLQRQETHSARLSVFLKFIRRERCVACPRFL
jgi:hypothetical protein